MNEKLQGAIEELEGLLKGKLQEVANIKKTINLLALQADLPQPYADADDPIAVGSATVRRDQFYGKTPIVAAREFLEMRGRAVNADEICSALKEGGFDYTALGWEEKSFLRNLAISLGKNTSIFHRLPNGSIGLLKWYPAASKKKEAKSANANNGSETQDDGNVVAEQEADSDSEKNGQQ